MVPCSSLPSEGKTWVPFKGLPREYPVGWKPSCPHSLLSSFPVPHALSSPSFLQSISHYEAWTHTLLSDSMGRWDNIKSPPKHNILVSSGLGISKLRKGVLYKEPLLHPLLKARKHERKMWLSAGTREKKCAHTQKRIIHEHPASTVSAALPLLLSNTRDTGTGRQGSCPSDTYNTRIRPTGLGPV